jgi:hypothetical protein
MFLINTDKWSNGLGYKFDNLALNFQVNLMGYLN